MGKDKEFKIRDKFMLNFSSRKEEKIEKISKWIHAQSNAQTSFLSLIEHTIDRYGYVDVTDHEVARKMYNEMLYFNGEQRSMDTVENRVDPEALTKESDKFNEVTETKAPVENKKEERGKIEINPDAF